MDKLEFISKALESASKLIWPGTVLALAYCFRTEARQFLGKTKSFKVAVPGGGEITLSGSLVDIALEELSRQIINNVKQLPDDERTAYLKIREAGGKKKVIELFTSFERSTIDKMNPEHTQLQSLRHKMLIRPFEGNEWRKDKYPIVTEYSRVAELLCPNLQVPK